MAELVFKHTGDSVELADGSPIAHACEEAGVPFACSHGFCGTCIIEVSDGMENLSDPTQSELDFLGEKGIKRERMACQCAIKSGKVEVSF